MSSIEHRIHAIIGLGNPGMQYHCNRHNIGFHIITALANRYGANWRMKDVMELSEIMVDDKKIFLIKPQTFMNASGKVLPYLLRQGVRPENILVIHDELEMPFGKIKLHFGGSARGHNGLRSIIDIIGKDFARLSFGIGRPEQREMVGQYVLSDFSEGQTELEQQIEQAIDTIEKTLVNTKNKKTANS